ncbi:proprotein convertase P-domain-containing protein, partial [bacterium]|nr:proprotein convertase P-domain-containing protein [bacterium]
GVPVADGQAVTGVDFTLNPPSGSISGRVLLCDGATPSGITVSAGAASTLTDGAGNYAITGLFDGSYTVTASMPGYLDQSDSPVVVSGGGGTTGVDFQLPTASVATPQTCPGLAIPDNNSTGATSSLNVVASFVPDEVRVNVQISHTWVGDVELRLEHPDGTVITLLDQPTGGGGGCNDNDMDITFTDAATVDANNWCDNTTPWFVGDGLPVQPLAPFTTKNCNGAWKLTAIDHVGSDTGTIDCWSLELVSSDPCLLGTDAPVIVSSVDALGTPRPNPFDTSTEVAFSLARPQNASVSVYDAAGRLVRMLQNGPAEAGAHTVTWDGRDRSGQRVSGGVYFVRLVRSEGPAETRKVTRLR